MSSPAAEAATAPVVWVSYAGPAPQRRLTIAFRIILAVPHFLYAGLLSLVSLFVVIAGWFAALVMGRLPAGMAEFLSRVVEYVARVNAYGLLLLTDRYPPFQLGRGDYAVDVEVPADLRLNRAAVLFRIVLMIPAGIVVNLLGNGLSVVVFVAWLLALMTGRLPVPLFEAFAAVLRYQVRFYAYAAMLTSEYPRGLFGDRREESEPPTAAPTPAPPASEQWESGEQARFGEPATPRITRLVLSKAAKWIIGLMLALGVVFGVATNAMWAMSDQSETAERLEESYLVLDEEAQRYTRETQRCAVAGGLDCLHQANRELADAVRAFQSDLRSLDFTDVSIEQAEEVDRDASELIGVLERMASTTDPDEYDRHLTDFQSLAPELDRDVQALLDTLYFS